MRVFLLDFRGRYLGGDMLIVAKTKRIAFNKAIKKLKEIDLMEKNEGLTIDDLVEVNTGTSYAVVIDDGDY